MNNEELKMNNEKCRICSANSNVGVAPLGDPRKRNTQNGITLIALIITIIILLILAVVSIRIVINGGIIGKSENAVKQYSESETEEKIQLAYTDYQMGKLDSEGYTFEQALTNGGVEYTSVVENSADEYTVIVNGIEYEVGKNGVSIGGVSISGAWTETTNDAGETIIENTQTGQTLKIGDYVNYDPTDGATTTSVTSNEADNGYGDQTFQLASYKNAGYGWRVLGIENGKIQLISDEFIGPDEGGYTNETYNRTYYYLQGQEGYINGVDELNKICGMYGQGKGAEGARSITVDDVNKITGYDPEVAKYNEGSMNEYGNDVTYTSGEGNALSSSGTNGQTWSGTQSTFKYYDENTRSFVDLTTGNPVTIKSTFYYYEPTTLNSNYEEPTKGVDENYNYDTTLSMLFGDYRFSKNEYNTWGRTFTGSGAPMNYWLASPYVYASYDDAYWGLRNVNGGGVNYLYDYYCYLCYSYGFTGSYSRGVRAVVSLKSDVQLEYNESTQEWQIK